MDDVQEIREAIGKIAYCTPRQEVVPIDDEDAWETVMDAIEAEWEGMTAEARAPYLAVGTVMLEMAENWSLPFAILPGKQEGELVDALRRVRAEAENALTALGHELEEHPLLGRINRWSSR